MTVDFPWTKLEPGQAFFVPCLDTAAMKEKGLRSAVPFRIKVDAKVGVCKGKIGVLFSRRR